MERVTGELRDSLIAGFSREAVHLEMRDRLCRGRSWQVPEVARGRAAGPRS